MTRFALLLSLLGAPAAAWEFTPDPVCTLTHMWDEGTVTVTYDPRERLAYTIAITAAAGWGSGAVFSIQFVGENGLTISTSRQQLADGQLQVSDSGFGNVLNGIAGNTTAIASLGAQSVRIPLQGAAPEVEKFRGCTKGGVA